MGSSWIAPVLLVGVMTCEFATLCLAAKPKLFWFDELISLHLSSLDASSLWRALRDGADGMTTTYYVLIRLARLIPGDPHVTLRLPSILGFLLAMAGVYWFTRRRLPASAGLAAALLLALSPFRDYALDARCYAMMVGFLAVSAALWQRIEDRQSLTPLFALFLTLGASAHGMAVVTIAFFGAAEFAWTILSRRIRWGVWASCVVAAVPFLLNLPMLQVFRRLYAQHFWSPAEWGTLLDAYKTYSGVAMVVSLAIVVAASLLVTGSFRLTLRGTATSIPELVLVGCFLWHPALLVILGKVQHFGFVPRYALPAILGLVLGFMHLTRSIWRSSAAAFALAGLFVAATAQGSLALKNAARPGPPRTDARWSELARLTRGNAALPVVIASGMRYFEASEYATAELRRQLVMVSDAETAVRLIGTDSLDAEFPVMAPYIPQLHVEDRVRFEAAHAQFFLYSGGFGDWITPYLTGKKYRFELLAMPAPDTMVALVTR